MQHSVLKRKHTFYNFCGFQKLPMRSLIYLQAEVKGDRWHAGGKERGRQHTYPDRSWFVLRSIQEQAGEVGGDEWAIAENVGSYQCKGQ
jgi:hypothetical protein